MAKRENISVSLTPEQVEFLAACVASGRYQSASEVVREGVRLLEHRHRQLELELERAKGMVREGLEHIDRGDVVDGDVFFREWDAELDAIDARRRQA